MRINRLLVAASLVATAACGADPRTQTGGSPTPSTSPTASGSSAAKAIMVYADTDDLWLYDHAADAVRRLTTDGPAARERLASFVGPDTIVFVVDDEPKRTVRMVAMTLSSGATRTVLERNGSIIALDAGRGGIAYLTVDHDKSEPHTLWLKKDLASSPRKLRTFPRHAGRGADQGDEISVHLTPVGTIVNDTALDTLESGGSSPTLFVIDEAGRDVVPPFDGVFGRGIDDRTILARERMRPSRWVSVDVATGARTVLPMTAATFRPAVSPDGQYVAYDDGAAEPTMYVFELATQKELLLSRPSVAAAWLTPRAVAGTATKPCSGDVCGEYAPWSAAGYATAVAVPQKTPARLRATSTIDADVLY